jgi:hypothetical protein
VLHRSTFHDTRHQLFMHVVEQGIDEAVKSRMTARNKKVFDFAHSCITHVALLLQINKTCFCRIQFDIILSLNPKLPLFSLSLKFSDLSYFKLNIRPISGDFHLILIQLIVPEGYQYKVPNYKFCPAFCSFLRVPSK